jgi:hypothetical protein
MILFLLIINHSNFLINPMNFFDFILVLKIILFHIIFLNLNLCIYNLLEYH